MKKTVSLYVLVGALLLGIAGGLFLGSYVERVDAQTMPAVSEIWNNQGQYVGPLTNGLRIQASTVTLDGTNPSSFTHGLTTVTACTVTNVRSTAMALDPHLFSYVVNGAAIDIYAWKPTGAADVTMIASTDADDVVSLVCMGT